MIANNYEWSWGNPGSCPKAEVASTNKKQRHQGNHVSRRTVKKEIPMWGKANKGKTFTSTSYIDHVVCAHCGNEYDQEWMSA